ncbi:MAG: cupin domain-containing protein [Actinomycetota bacterium]
MTESPTVISLPEAFAGLEFLPDRKPQGNAGIPEGQPAWYATIADYRNGGIFIVHYAGESQWERHDHGDEIVMCLEGATTMTLLIDGEQVPVRLGAQQMVVVPEGTWHRFDTPDGAKIMTVTPQPTIDSVEDPT